MTIGKICTRTTVIAKSDDSVKEIAMLMRQHHVGDIVIIKETDGENVPVGIVTDRDLVIELIAQGLSPETVTVGDIMTDIIVTARDDEGIWDVLQKMRIKGVRRMPIVGRHGGLMGIVSLDDLLELLSDELAMLAKIINREQEREQRARR
jgi:CBS domain-containing protein